MHNEKLDNIFLMVLLTITIAILFLHNFSLNQSLIIDVNTPYSVGIITDKSLNTSGDSEAKLTNNNDHYLLDCEIKSSEYAWPFCEMTINFTTNKEGEILPPIDLSKLTNVKVYAQYIGENSAGIRFQLRTYNPAYSTYTNDASWKYNGIEYKPEKNSYPVSFSLDTLQVATWWLLENEIPIEHSAPDFKQVMVLEIATGNGIAPGNYQLEIERVEFNGKVFTNKQIFTSIILMWILAAFAGLFINLKRSKNKLVMSINRSKELKNQSERDPLTGALNRSGIEPIFTNEIEILSLIFIDIDHFKSINDNYGHPVGDDILIEFVNIISKNCRATDFLSRWGGEEFLLICPNTKLNEAAELAESLRCILSEHNWIENIRLTSSFGVAQKEEEESIDKFIERADQALYAAKAQGRNKVVVLNKTTSGLID